MIGDHEQRPRHRALGKGDEPDAPAQRRGQEHAEEDDGAANNTLLPTLLLPLLLPLLWMLLLLPTAHAPTSARSPPFAWANLRRLPNEARATDKAELRSVP